MKAWMILTLVLVVASPVANAAALDVQEAPPAPEAQQETREEYGQLSLEDLLRVRIVTASQQSEALREAPVPVTVITRDMIRAIGARHLQDLLTTYVPGMTLVADHNELNVAMHGVYGSSQQKILVMLDGHRLNSRAYSMANPDYSIRIDLDRVEQIEVLRGPGSSLYGNVALTAVVNVVTRSGQQIDGLSLTAAGGSYASGLDTDSAQDFLAAGTSLGLTYGKRLAERHDLVLWGGWFRADGERIPVSRAEDYSRHPRDGFAHVDSYQDGSSYDVGLRYKAGGVSFLANHRYGKLREPFSSSGQTGEVYDPAAFRSFQGKGPGIGSLSTHLEARYAPSATGAVSYELVGYYDRNTLDGPLVSDPESRSISMLNWTDDAIGGTAQLRWDYRRGDAGASNLLLGTQVDRMRLIDSNLPIQEGGEWVRFGDSAATPLIQPGRETIYSGFTQLRHRFSSQWIANLGARLDVKDRHLGANVTDLSPRAALVWVPGSRFDLKLSYGRSFVDAPYWYRYNVFPAYQGSQDLEPEHLQSLQLTPSLNFKDGKLRNTLNLYYNHVTDFVFRNNAAKPGEPRYANAGMLQTVGVENETSWIGRNLRVNANLSWQHVVDSEKFDAREGQVFDVPSFVANLVVDVNPLGSRFDRARVNLSLRYSGRQLSPIASTFRLAGDGTVVAFQDPNHHAPDYLLANLGLRFSRVITRGGSFELTVFNLFDQRYWQGGSTLFPYPQAGRSIVARIGYQLGGR